MALKTCPNCQTKCGPKQKICPNSNCKFKFPIKSKNEDDDNDDDYEDDIPERLCSICNDSFRPSITKRSASGQPYYVWHYNNYCSSGCFETGEEKLFDFIFNLIQENKIEVPDDIKNIVNIDSFGLRKIDTYNINYAAFIKLISPQKKYIPATVDCPPEFERVEKPILSPEEFEDKFGRKPPKKSVENLENIENDYPEDSIERQVADLANLPLGDYLDHILDDPKISIEAKKDLKPTRGQKKCPNKECGKITGVKKRICDGCGYEFPFKSMT